MSVQVGESITVEQLDSLFERVKNLKNIHINSQHQLSSSLTPPIDNSGLSPGDLITPNEIQVLQNELANLANSFWAKPYGANEMIYMTDFSQNFSIPEVGELITASDFNLIDNTISIAEQIVPNYDSRYSSQYGYQYSYKYNAQYGYQYSSQYITQYGSKYGSQYGYKYSYKYGYQYGSQYGYQYFGKYGYRYGSKYSYKYGTRYSYRSSFF